MIRSHRLSWQTVAAAAGAALILAVAGCGQNDSKPNAPASAADIAKMQASLHPKPTNNVVFESSDYAGQLHTVFKPEKPPVVVNQKNPMALMQTVKDTRVREAMMLGMGLNMGHIAAGATVHTNKGDFTITIYPAAAPIASGDFIDLAFKKFYDGLKFWRYESGYIIQGGDPKNNGTGGPGYTIPDDAPGTLKHVAGAVVMAKAGPNTAGSQFYITLAPQHQLDKSDAVFGMVTHGMDVVKKLRAGDTIESVTLTGLPPGFDPSRVMSMMGEHGMPPGGRPAGAAPGGTAPVAVPAMSSPAAH